MSPLSPAKYIQTRVRTLPIYKCLVSKSWKTSQFAGVIVLRKHNNGNVTAGMYNMDLHCLGIKMTSFLFNRPEEELIDQLEAAPDPYEEVTYTLAHNIVFAGHDFALEYDIHPHKDFEITRFILEDDTDDIPLIDVPVGTGGKPHLMVVTANQRPEVLAKLIKNAGPGNFLYSVAEQQDFNEYFLDSIPPGNLNCKNVLIIADLDDEAKVSERNPIEQAIIKAEWYTRKVPVDSLYVTEEEEAGWKEKWVVEFTDLPSGTDQEQFAEYNKVLDKIVSGRPTGSKEDLEEKLTLMANEYADNPVLMAVFYEKATIMGMEKLKMIAELHAQKLYTQYPLVKLTLALGTLIGGLEEGNDDDDDDDRYEVFGDIYEAESIRDLFPGQSEFHQSEFITFALIKMLICVFEEDLPFAVKFYHMIANSGGEGSAFLPYVWAEYGSYLMDLVEGDDEEEEESLN